MNLFLEGKTRPPGDELIARVIITTQIVFVSCTPTLAPLAFEDKNAPSSIFSIKALVKHYCLVLTKERLCAWTWTFGLSQFVPTE